MNKNYIWKCSTESFNLPFLIIKENYGCIPINSHYDLLNRLEREDLKFENNMILSVNEFSIYLPKILKIFKSTK